MRTLVSAVLKEKGQNERICQTTAKVSSRNLAYKDYITSWLGHIVLINQPVFGCCTFRTSVNAPLTSKMYKSVLCSHSVTKQAEVCV